MKTIKVLGTGCTNCNSTLNLIKTISQETGVSILLEKVEELSEIMRYGVMSTPGVVIDDNVVHSGGIPDRATVESWLKSDSECCSGTDTDNSKNSCCG